MRLHRMTITVSLVTAIAACGDYGPSDLEEDTGEAQYELAAVPDFRLGLALKDGTYIGETQYTESVDFGTTESPWAQDNNCYKPDAARLDLKIEDINYLILDKDFRIGMVGAAGYCNHTPVGEYKFTPWASEGGGWSDIATDNNGWDPDTYRIKVETRPWPSAAENISDFQVGLRAYDGVYNQQLLSGPSVYSPWASDGGGTTDWACDNNCQDPDGFKVYLGVRRDCHAGRGLWDYCHSTCPCNVGLGDCDSDADCMAGLSCVYDVGAEYGYSADVDVCLEE